MTTAYVIGVLLLAALLAVGMTVLRWAPLEDGDDLPATPEPEDLPPPEKRLWPEEVED